MMELSITRKEMSGNLLGHRFLEYKRYIILLMIRSIYQKDDLIYMFRFEPGEDFEFRELLFEHYTCEVNAQELATLMDMPFATFNRKFKKAFGMPVGEWLTLKKKANVLMDLKTTDLTVKEIASKYNLTPNYLTSFCKKYLGDTPMNLRESDD